MPTSSILRLLLLFLTLCLPALALADLLPLPPHRAHYLLTRDALPFATMTMGLVHTADGGYRYSSTTRPHPALSLLGNALEISANARVSEQSEGHLEAGRYRPDHYRFRRDNDGNRELTIDFDWANGRAAMDSADKPWSMPVLAGTVDKLAVLLVLRQDLSAGTADLTYPVADGGKLKSYCYRIAGRERISTPNGSWESVELTRSKQGGPIDYRLWLAKGLNYLPVLVEREEDSVLFRMDLTKVEGLGPQQDVGSD